MQVFDKTPVGRMLHAARGKGPIRLLDRTKTAYLRRFVFMAKARKEFDSFLNSAGSAWGAHQDLNNKLRNKTDKERFEWLKTREASRYLEDIGRYTRDTMGDWISVMRSGAGSVEQYGSALVMFYPFVRMSVKWAMWSLPVKHPYRAMILGMAAQANAAELRDLFEGERSKILSSYSQAVMHPSETEKSLLNMNRSTPMSGFTEALGSPTDITGFFNVIMPALVIPTEAFVLGRSAFTGKPLIPKGALFDEQGLQRNEPGVSLDPGVQLTWSEKMDYFWDQVKQMPPPMRIARALTKGTDWRNEFGEELKSTGGPIADALSPGGRRERSGREKSPSRAGEAEAPRPVAPVESGSQVTADDNVQVGCSDRRGAGSN